MVEIVAENYHNIWAKMKKTDLISKGVVENRALVCLDQPLFNCSDCKQCYEFH